MAKILDRLHFRRGRRTFEAIKMYRRPWLCPCEAVDEPRRFQALGRSPCLHVWCRVWYTTQRECDYLPNLPLDRAGIETHDNVGIEMRSDLPQKRNELFGYIAGGCAWAPAYLLVFREVPREFIDYRVLQPLWDEAERLFRFLKNRQIAITWCVEVVAGLCSLGIERAGTVAALTVEVFGAGKERDCGLVSVEQITRTEVAILEVWLDSLVERELQLLNARPAKEGRWRRTEEVTGRGIEADKPVAGESRT
jgi:hypothetical protein